MSLHGFLDAIGRCPRCFRRSLAAAVLFWAMTLGPWLLAPYSVAWEIPGTLAVLATILWLMHMGVFTARATAKVVSAAADDVDESRRKALRTVGRGLALGAGLGITLSMIPASKLHADEVPGCLQDALCDANHPCSGCTCHYPPGATTGYCR